MFLKNKNIIFKSRRSKVTDYAALKLHIISNHRAKFKNLALKMKEEFAVRVRGIASLKFRVRTCETG